MQCLNNSSTQFWKTKLEFPAKINYLLWMGAAAKWTKFPTFLIGYCNVSSSNTSRLEARTVGWVKSLVSRYIEGYSFLSISCPESALVAVSV